MASEILKRECSFLTMRPETVNHSNPSTLASILLFLNRMTGAMLGGIGVMVLVANVLISSALLLGGPGFVIEFLAQ